MNIQPGKSISQAAMTGLIVLASTFAALAQGGEFPNFKATPTGKGIMLMNKKGAPDFAVLIEGGSEPEYDPADGGLRMKTTDGGEVSVYLADAKLFAKAKTDSAETLMKSYRARLNPPIKVVPPEKFAVDTELNATVPIFDLRGGKDEKALVYASSWSIPVSGGAKAARRVYLSFVIGDSILTLRKDFPPGEDTDEQNRAFASALSTLTLLPPQQKKVIAAPKKQPVKTGTRKN